MILTKISYMTTNATYQALDDLRDKYLSIVSEVKGVDVKVKPLHDSVTYGIKTEIPILFQIITGTIPKPELRPPINLCLTEILN